MLPSAAFNSRPASASLTPSFVVRTSSQWRLSVTLPPLYAVHLRIRLYYHTALLKIVVSRDDLEFDIGKNKLPAFVPRKDSSQPACSCFRKERM